MVDTTEELKETLLLAGIGMGSWNVFTLDPVTKALPAVVGMVMVTGGNAADWELEEVCGTEELDDP